MSQRATAIMLALSLSVGCRVAEGQSNGVEPEVAESSGGLGASFLASLLTAGNASPDSSGPKALYSVHHLWATSVFGGIAPPLPPQGLDALVLQEGLGLGLNGMGAYLAAFVAQHESEVQVRGRSWAQFAEDDTAPAWFLLQAGIAKLR